jgi:hypothetical protein
VDRIEKFQSTYGRLEFAQRCVHTIGFLGKGLTPSRKIKKHTQKFGNNQNICIFEFLLKLSGCALPMQGTHSGLAKGGFSASMKLCASYRVQCWLTV